MDELIWYELLEIRKMKTCCIATVSKRLCKHILYKSSIGETYCKWYISVFKHDEGSEFYVTAISPQSLINNIGGTCIITKGRIL